MNTVLVGIGLGSLCALAAAYGVYVQVDQWWRERGIRRRANGRKGYLTW